MRKTGTLHGSYSLVLQKGDGQIQNADSIAAGLDYAGVGPEHGYLRKSGRVTYTTAHDDDALEAFYLLSRVEGIIPALESAHALAEVVRLAPTLPREAVIVVNLSGRGTGWVPFPERGKEPYKERFKVLTDRERRRGCLHYGGYLFGGSRAEIGPGRMRCGYREIGAIFWPMCGPVIKPPLPGSSGRLRGRNSGDGRRVRQQSPTLVLMSYYNPILRVGLQNSAARQRGAT